MDYLVHPDMSEEIDNREADPLTGNIILKTLRNTNFEQCQSLAVKRSKKGQYYNLSK